MKLQKGILQSIVTRWIRMRHIIFGADGHMKKLLIILGTSHGVIMTGEVGKVLLQKLLKVIDGIHRYIPTQKEVL